MKKLFLILLAFFCMQFCFSQNMLSIRDYKTLSGAISLKFEDFPTAKQWNGKRVAPVLDTDLKKTYRTLIRKNAEEEPNFNGIYRIAEFGAGTGWHGFFVINLETGSVTEGIFNDLGLEYTKDSRLIIVNPPDVILDYWQDEEFVPIWAKSIYALFENESFIKILEVYNNNTDTGKQSLESQK